MRHSYSSLPTTKKQGRRRGTAATNCVHGAQDGDTESQGKTDGGSGGSGGGGGGGLGRGGGGAGCRPSVSNKTLCAVYASGQKITKLLAEHHWFLGFWFFFSSLSRACGTTDFTLHSLCCRGQVTTRSFVVDSGEERVVSIPPSPGSHCGNDDQQVGDVADAVQQVWCDACEVLVGELTGRKNVDHIGWLLRARCSRIDNASSLL